MFSTILITVLHLQQSYKADFEAIKNYLSTIDWENELNKSNSIDSCWEIFTSHINFIKSKFIPTKKVNSGNILKRNFTIDESLHCLIKNKRHFFKFYKKYPSETNRILYNLARNKVITKTRKVKRDKERTIAKKVKSNPKIFYQYIASKTTQKEGVADLTKTDGTLTQNDKEKIDVINEFF